MSLRLRWQKNKFTSRFTQPDKDTAQSWVPAQTRQYETYWVICLRRGNLQHHVGVEQIWWEKYPENVVDEQAGQKQARDFQAWKS